MDLSLQGQVAVVTGAGRGLGLAIARRLGQAGAWVWILELDEGRGNEAARTLREEGIRADSRSLDVREASSVDQAFDEVLTRAGQVDILVNNAGVAILGDSADFPIQDWQIQLDVMLTGLFLCCRRVGHEMVSQKRGAIINISSIGGLGGWPQRSAYNSAKAGVANLTQNLASEWGPFGVRINAIAPGVIHTDMIRVATDAGILQLSDYEDRIPMGHLGDPKDIAEAATFLASPRASAVNGVILRVDGGWNAAGNP